MEPWSLNITVSYVLRDDVDIDEAVGGIAEFVGKVGADHPGILYVSGRSITEPRAFRHTIRVRTPADLAVMQAAPFFEAFGPWLKSRCAEGPTVDRYVVVAATG